jgi:hypothetical protein
MNIIYCNNNYFLKWIFIKMKKEIRDDKFQETIVKKTIYLLEDISEKQLKSFHDFFEFLLVFKIINIFTIFFSFSTKTFKIIF